MNQNSLRLDSSDKNYSTLDTGGKNYSTLEQIKVVLSQINYRDWWIRVEQKNEGFYLQVAFMAPDSDQPNKVIEQRGRKWILSPYMTKSELILTAFKAIMTAEEHEVRERFLYKGKRILGPHIDVDTLWNVCDQVDVRQDIGDQDAEQNVEADWEVELEKPILHENHKRRRTVMFSQ